MTASTTVLETLTDTVFDSVEGYRKAADKATSPQLKQALTERAQRRQATLDQLNNALQRQGGNLVTKGTTAGALHRLWTDVSDLFGSGDATAAQRVEEGEDYLATKFEEALKTDDLDPQVRAVIQAAYSEIKDGERFTNTLERFNG